MNIYRNFYDVFVVLLVVIAGLYLSYRLSWKHITSFFLAIKLLVQSEIKQRKKSAHISSFAALSTIIGGNLGVGNISGVAVALSTGGPGSIVWMIIVILVIGSIKYASCFLGIKYRVAIDKQKSCGGPMYYLARVSPKTNLLSILFSIALLMGALTVGNLVQVNSITLPMVKIGIPPLYGGIVIAILVLIIVISGLKTFEKVISIVVPIMAIVYLGICTYVLIINYGKTLPAIELLCLSAFTGQKQVLGGVFGYGIVEMLCIGTSHGVFATDTGLGLEAIVHSSVSKHGKKEIPEEVKGAIISTISPLIVICISLMTALVLIITGVWKNTALESTNMFLEAFSIGCSSNYIGYLLVTLLFFFSFTTILTWLFCAEKTVSYLAPNSCIALRIWRACFILLLPIGTLLKVSFLWNLADIVIKCMLIFNIYGVLWLSKEIR